MSTPTQRPGGASTAATAVPLTIRRVGGAGATPAPAVAKAPTPAPSTAMKPPTARTISPAASTAAAATTTAGPFARPKAAAVAATAAAPVTKILSPVTTKPFKPQLTTVIQPPYTAAVGARQPAASTSTSTSAGPAALAHQELDVGVTIDDNVSVSVSVSQLEPDDDELQQQERALEDEIEEKAVKLHMSPDAVAQQLEGIAQRKVVVNGQIIRRRFRPRNDDVVPPAPKMEIRGHLTSSPLPEHFWGYMLAFVASFFVAFVVLLAASNIVGESISLGIFSALSLVGAFVFAIAYYLVRPMHNKLNTTWIDPYTSEYDRIQLVIRLMKSNQKLTFLMLIGMELALLTALFTIPVVCVDLEFFTLLNEASPGRKAAFVFLTLSTFTVVVMTTFVQYYCYGWNVSCCTAIAQYQEKQSLSSRSETLYPSAADATGAAGSHATDANAQSAAPAGS